MARDVLLVQKFFVRLTGDLESGILLSQIVYWFTPNNEGKSKLRVWHDGVPWIAKTREEWEEEIMLSPAKYKVALKKLLDMNLVEKKIYKFNANPTTHLRITDHFVDVYYDYLANLSSS